MSSFACTAARVRMVRVRTGRHEDLESVEGAPRSMCIKATRSRKLYARPEHGPATARLSSESTRSRRRLGARARVARFERGFLRSGT